MQWIANGLIGCSYFAVVKAAEFALSKQLETLYFLMHNVITQNAICTICAIQVHTFAGSLSFCDEIPSPIL